LNKFGSSAAAVIRNTGYSAGTNLANIDRNLGHNDNDHVK